MKTLSAFLYGYIYSDSLTVDQVTNQLYTTHTVMLYIMIQAYSQTINAEFPALHCC